MSDSETIYSFRTLVPRVLQRERTQEVKLEVHRNGQLVDVTAAGSTYTLLDPAGRAVVDAQPVVISGKVPTYTIQDVQLPDTLEFSELYQERWALVIDGATHTVRREAAVAPFLVFLPVADVDLMAGEYPDLIEALGQYGTTFQPFLDRAFRDVLEELWKRGRWPDLMLSASAFVKPVRELALFRIFKFLFRHTGGSGGVNRWQTLMEHHQEEWKGAISDFRSRIDHDIDGLPDSRNRESSATVVQRNAHHIRRHVRSSRW